MIVPKIIFKRCSTQYRVRFQAQYGHFLRDNILYIYNYLKTEDLLDKDYVLYIPTVHYGFNRAFKKFILDVFPKAIVMEAPRNRGRRYHPEAEQLVKEFVQRMDDGDEEVTIIGEEQLAGYKPIWDGEKHKKVRTESLKDFPKHCADDFRDYCFKQYKFSPNIKKRLLYVPRKITDPYVGGRADGRKDLRMVKSQCRYLNDATLIKNLKELCEANNYEFLEWENCCSVFEQIEAYSESDIVVGVQGSDWANAIWTNENQLLLELVPRPECSSCDQWPFDFSVMFYSKHLQQQVDEARLSDWYEFNKKQKRNWQNVILKNACSKEHRTKETTSLTIQEEERKEVVQKIQNYISLSKDSS